MGHTARWQIALDGSQHFAGKTTAEFVIAVAGEPGAEILIFPAALDVFAQEPLDSVRDKRSSATVADGTGDAGVLSYGSAQAKVVGIRQLAFMLDFLSFDADVGNPVLAAAVGTAGDMKPKLLIKLWQALFEFLDKPTGKAFCLRDGKFAKFGAGAGDSAAPEIGRLDD